VLFSLYYEAVLIAMALIYVRFIERRPPRSIGLARQRFFVRYAAGFGIGFVLLALYSVLPLLSADVSYTGITWLVLLYLGAFIVQSAAEEILFRGYMMSALMRRGGAMQAVLWSTVLFALSHIPGSSISIGELLQIFLLGAVLALFVLRTGSLWGAMGLHAAWNFFTGCLSPIQLGPYRIGYSVLSFPASLEQGALDYIIAFAVFIAAIALLLFAGKRKLVAVRTEQQTIFDNAVKIMRNASRGYGEFRSYALRVAETAEGKSKAAALLHYAVWQACRRQSPPARAAGAGPVP
jgi:membrane protease YdiL (CAAX protease family)